MKSALLDKRLAVHELVLNTTQIDSLVVGGGHIFRTTDDSVFYVIKNSMRLPRKMSIVTNLRDILNIVTSGMLNHSGFQTINTNICVPNQQGKIDYMANGL